MDQSQQQPTSGRPQNRKPNPKRLALYGFFAIIILFFIAIFLFIRGRSDSAGDGFRLPVRPEPVVTEKVKTDRLAIMNLLNEFNLPQNQPSEDATQAEKNELNLAQIDRILGRLSTVQPDEAVVPARDDLIKVFGEWKRVIERGNDARQVRYIRDELKGVAAEYDWLTTVLWIIILNRL